jgi:hypothetical protein
MRVAVERELVAKLNRRLPRAAAEVSGPTGTKTGATGSAVQVAQAILPVGEWRAAARATVAGGF